MSNNPYFTSLLQVLNQHGVNYVIVKDNLNDKEGLHIWVGAETDNKDKLLEAIEASGLETLIFALAKPQPLPVQLPQGQLKLEVLHSMEGYAFKEAYQDAEELNWEGEMNVKIISCEDLIKHQNN